MEAILKAYNDINRKFTYFIVILYYYLTTAIYLLPFTYAITLYLPLKTQQPDTLLRSKNKPWLNNLENHYISDKYFVFFLD